MWTDKQLRTLSSGGNDKLAEFFDRYDLNAEKDIKVRYATKAAAYYRKRNAALATAADFTEEEPSYEEGRCNMYDNKSIDAGKEKETPKDDGEKVDEKADPKIEPEEKEPQSPGDELEFEEPV
jgi:hypothetical protein